LGVGAGTFTPHPEQREGSSPETSDVLLLILITMDNLETAARLNAGLEAAPHDAKPIVSEM
jgi:hypothetical protein